MTTFPDKSQRPASGSAAVCPRCHGQRSVKNHKGKAVPCPTCRGTGTATGQFITK